MLLTGTTGRNGVNMPSIPTVIRRPLAKLKRAAEGARRFACEQVGISRYSWQAQHNLDRKLAKHLDFDHGVFIEAGANDGVSQSNTYYFEKIRTWMGLLIEPVPTLAAKCKASRWLSTTKQAALVPSEVPGGTVEMHVAGLMSCVTGALGDSESTSRHVEAGLRVQKLSATRSIQVPARTLSSLIDEWTLVTPVGRIDLLSLDVEGGEVDALRGLDLQRHAPRFICVEVRDGHAGEVGSILDHMYEQVDVLHDAETYRDVLYQLR